ncbi:MAG: iron-containing alcohol dehydrogenase [Magnetococcales bacterium]|nr:iron-containing alcohol dehydrogenase [Magnetococcales bacterium]
MAAPTVPVASPLSVPPLVLAPFTIAALPKILFGSGVLDQVVPEAARFGRRLLVVTGGRSLDEHGHWERLRAALTTGGFSWERFRVEGEPSPELVDRAVAAFTGQGFDLVVAVGGGSVLDAGKAIAGLLPTGESVMAYLEGVGRGEIYQGPALPLIAVPTTAGTGSEATKNAVLSRQGPDGFKKSFRDDRLVARVAIVDPDLLATCPRPLLAADAMDAFTQLLESFTSTRANPLTDALAWSGMVAFRQGFFPLWEDRETAFGRSALAYAALLSGVCLAQTGLGAVHGMASPLGALFPLPHGVACGTLLAETTATNIAALRARLPGSPALPKYASVGRLLTGKAGDDGEALEGLVATLRDWQERLELPLLSRFGVTRERLAPVVAESRGSSMKTNPLVLNDGEIEAILCRRLGE